MSFVRLAAERGAGSHGAVTRARGAVNPQGRGLNHLSEYGDRDGRSREVRSTCASRQTFETRRKWDSSTAPLNPSNAPIDPTEVGGRDSELELGASPRPGRIRPRSVCSLDVIDTGCECQRGCGPGVRAVLRPGEGKRQGLAGAYGIVQQARLRSRSSRWGQGTPYASSTGGRR